MKKIQIPQNPGSNNDIQNNSICFEIKLKTQNGVNLNKYLIIL